MLSAIKPTSRNISETVTGLLWCQLHHFVFLAFLRFREEKQSKGSMNEGLSLGSDTKTFFCFKTLFLRISYEIGPVMNYKDVMLLKQILSTLVVMESYTYYMWNVNQIIERALGCIHLKRCPPSMCDSVAAKLLGVTGWTTLKSAKRGPWVG